MDKIICSKCKKVYEVLTFDKCPHCGSSSLHVYNFQNSDDYLKTIIPKIQDERKESGLSGLVLGLESININTEPDRQIDTVKELISTTGYNTDDAYENQHTKKIILKSEKSGIQFLTDNIIHFDNYSFIQTIPSRYTGNSLGFIQWHQNRGKYAESNDNKISYNFDKPNKKYLKNIKQLDHAATRVRAQNRDASIIEFMELTNYDFKFAIYVKIFNSITNVARISKKDFAMVFTSGVTPYIDDKSTGPTEKFINKYGPRVHHLAFHTENIEDTVHQLDEDGMRFLIGLVGSPKEGLKQTFSQPSPNTLLVNEYIHRYGDFDGFFTKENVTLLTGATEKQ